MKKSEKLKIVFDFIADYLSDDDGLNDTTNNEVTSGEIHEKEGTEDSNMKRSYEIMKKVDELDKQNANVNKKVSEKLADLQKQMKEHFENKDRVYGGSPIPGVPSASDLGLKFEEKTGVTLDDSGKMVEVRVKTMPKVSIKEIMNEIENNN